MQKLKTSFRTMLIIGISLGFILGSFASAWKVGTDSSGNKWGWLNNNLGYIATSNGDLLYPPTGTGFQQAVWSFNGTGLGGTIYLPSGTTYIDRTINISHIGITIQGMGWDASFIYLAHGSNCDGIKIFTAIGTDTPMWITLKDFTIDGEKAFNTKGSGINITLSDNGYISNVYATGWARHGIWINTVSEVWTINNVHTDNCGVDGIHISGGCGDNKLYSINSYGNTNDGLSIAGVSNDLYSCRSYANGGDGIQVEGNLNRFTSCQAWDNAAEGFYVTDHDQTIGATSLVDSKAYGNDDSGFRIWGKNVVLRGCISYDIFGSVYVQNYGLQVDTGSIDITVDSCNMSGSVSNPIPQSVNMTIINSKMQSISSYNYIVNSLGHSFIPSQSGLQQSIWDLNSSGGGWVELPTCNITITSTIYVTSNVWLRGAGASSVLYLADNANTSFIKNEGSRYTPRRLNYNIKISDILLNGNCYQQPIWVPGNDIWTPPNGIGIWNGRNTTINNVKFNNITQCCIYLLRSNWSMVRDCTFYNFGGRYARDEGSIAVGHFPYFASGVFVDGGQNFTISGCHFNKGYSGAIITQSTYGDYKFYTRNGIIDDCIVYNCHYGYYAENARNIKVSNFIVYNSTKSINDVPIQPPYAFLIGTGNTENIKLTACGAYNCGNSITATGGSYAISGSNNSAVSCDSYYSRVNGMDISGYRNIVSLCTIINASRKGIYSLCIEPQITNNNILRSWTYGMYVGAATSTASYYNKFGLISGNNINGTNSDAIYCSLYNTSLISNNIYNTGVGYGIWSLGKYNRISLNTISKAGYRGIYFSGPGNNTITNNIVILSTNGIELGSNVKNTTIIGNRILVTASAIVEQSGCNFNIIKDNNVRGSPSLITVVGSKTICRDNQGYVTESWGVATLSNNASIDHGLSAAPTIVIINGQNWNTTVSVNATTITTAHFHVELRKLSDGTVAVGRRTVTWYAKV